MHCKIKFSLRHYFKFISLQVSFKKEATEKKIVLKKSGVNFITGLQVEVDRLLRGPVVGGAGDP